MSRIPVAKADTDLLSESSQMKNSKLAALKRSKYGLKSPFGRVKDRTPSDDLKELNWAMAELAKAKSELARHKFKEQQRHKLLEKYKKIDAEKQNLIEKQNRSIDGMIQRNQKLNFQVSDLKYKLEHLKVKFTMFKTIY